jgi:hypothetical protein
MRHAPWCCGTIEVPCGDGHVWDVPCPGTCRSEEDRCEVCWGLRPGADLVLSDGVQVCGPCLVSSAREEAEAAEARARRSSARLRAARARSGGQR